MWKKLALFPSAVFETEGGVLLDMDIMKIVVSSCYVNNLLTLYTLSMFIF